MTSRKIKLCYNRNDKNKNVIYYLVQTDDKKIIYLHTTLKQIENANTIYLI